jgi:hypothetical protein
MAETPMVRAVLGCVTHADGIQTCGLHVRTPSGDLAFVDLTEDTMDWGRLAWALTEARRLLLAGCVVAPDRPR